MNLRQKILAFLDENKIIYQSYEHKPVFTSEEAAAARGDISLHQGAKAMVLKIINSQLIINNSKSGLPDPDFVMAVLPGDRKIDFKKLRKYLVVKDLRFASAEEVERIVGVKIGAVSPFGNLSGLKVFLDESIRDNEEIVFNVGEHTQSVKMRLADYQRLVQPTVVDFAQSS